MKVIIGAGPTGLGAAWQLEQLGQPWTLYEAEPKPGGLSASFHNDDYVWDIGGHVLHSHYPSFDKVLSSVLPASDWLTHKRSAFIRIKNRWIPYPLQNNIHRLPISERTACLAGLREAQLKPVTKPSNFNDWILDLFGAGIADLFMKPYNSKVWNWDLKDMATGWLGDRVPVPSVTMIEKAIKENIDNASWGPNSMFKFPLYNGTGAIWQAIAEALPQDRLCYSNAVIRVDTKKQLVHLQNGETRSYDQLITTMPLDNLIRIARIDGLSTSVDRLAHNSGLIIGIGVSGDMPAEGRAKSWTYYPDPTIPFYRVTLFSNYSPNNAPRGTYSLMAEISHIPGKALDASDLVKRTTTSLHHLGLINDLGDINTIWTKKIQYSYPIPTIGRDGALAEIHAALASLNIFSRGRFGAWKYEVGNMDHCFMQGAELADYLVSGKEENTIHYPDRVNAA